MRLEGWKDAVGHSQTMSQPLAEPGCACGAGLPLQPAHPCCEFLPLCACGRCPPSPHRLRPTVLGPHRRPAPWAAGVWSLSPGGQESTSKVPAAWGPPGASRTESAPGLRPALALLHPELLATWTHPSHLCCGPPSVLPASALTRSFPLLGHAGLEPAAPSLPNVAHYIHSNLLPDGVTF